jgi:hypothetical protein
MNQEVAKIIAITQEMAAFWRKSYGWAPRNAADLLAAARLDRQVSFAHTLYDYLETFPPCQVEAKQILGYATLRSMCEGVLKLFFAVYFNDYSNDPDAVRDRKKNIVEPGDVNFDRLIALYSKKADSTHDAFLRRIQARGNGIHHFTDRDMGTQSELISDICQFLEFIDDVDSGLPYP